MDIEAVGSGGWEPPAGKLKTKIVCTMGPSSRNAEMLTKMAAAGMDVARINSGHCDVDEVRGYVELVRKAGEAAGKRIGVMLDLQGPRLRVGPIRGASVQLVKGQDFTISTVQSRGDASRISVAYEGLPRDLEPGDAVFIDDGLIRMKVRDVAGTEIRCEVIEGGTLLQGKGMNFPGSDLKLESFTARDRAYLEAGLATGIDWVAQSFIRTAADVRGLTAAMDEIGLRVPVMAKIEKPEALRNIDEIIDVADAIMVARGDLGVEMEAEDVPLAQKELIKRAVRAARPVLTATQMLESMVDNPRPTRAEASDVANAILDGTDALMLSAETAIGSYPVRVVEMMTRIAAKAERAIDYPHILEERGRWAHQGVADAIGYASCKIAADLKARAIVTLTRSGYTARLVARYRPEARIVAVSPDEKVVDTMSMVWGVSGLVVPEREDLRQLIKEASSACVSAGYAASGDVVVVTGGFLDEERGKTNSVHVHTVE